MRAALIVGLLLHASSVWACRIVCSEGSTLWHLLRDDEASETFQVLRDSETLNSGLTCHLLAPSGTEEEREEQRLVNLCYSPQDAQGKREVFRTERVQRRNVRVAEGKPIEDRKDQLVWTWEIHSPRPETGKNDVKVVRVVEMNREDCGSAADR